MKGRFRRLCETFIAKKYVAWAVACAFLWYGKITGTDWVLLTAAIFTLDLFTKSQVGVPKGERFDESAI
ncbi:MAG TPA: hypothetical protein DCS05_00480 [Nitrospiraceae bacterium]|nr:hypothetical protein [Nitrospiraceae bacterium]